MKQIVLQPGGVDSAPRVTAESVYPNIDSTYTEVTYSGPRLAVRQNNSFGVKPLSGLQGNMQGVAIYGNTLVRMANGSTHYIYTISSAGAVAQVATFSASCGHSNSLQFAPIVESGQTFPYLYVAGLSRKCYVLSISSAYAVTLVQTITIADGVGADGDIQIGDDGYIWMAGLDNNHAHFVKFRKVAVSEGDVTLTSDDVLDEWLSDMLFPSATYLWQGMMIHNGKLWLCFGATGAGQNRGLAVFDTATHALDTWLDMGNWNQELEDLDIWQDSVIVTTYGNTYFLLKF